LSHHEGAKVEDLEVLVGPVEKSTFVGGQLFADERLLTVGHRVADDDSIVNLKNKINSESSEVRFAKVK
jgi:hypothetical protein